MYVVGCFNCIIQVFTPDIQGKIPLILLEIHFGIPGIVRPIFIADHPFSRYFY